MVLKSLRWKFLKCYSRTNCEGDGIFWKSIKSKVSTDVRPQFVRYYPYKNADNSSLCSHRLRQQSRNIVQVIIAFHDVAVVVPASVLTSLYIAILVYKFVRPYDLLNPECKNYISIDNRDPINDVPEINIRTYEADDLAPTCDESAPDFVDLN